MAAGIAVLVSAAAYAAGPAGPLERDFAGWDRQHTEHFTFIYEPRDAAAVAELVSFSEDVYQDVTGLVGSRPPRVWVVIAGRVDLANAFTTPAPPHITLYLAPPSEPLIGLESSDYLRLLLAHELTHLVNFEYDWGMFYFLSRLFGPAVKDANAAFLPTWFLEGIATVSETEFTDGGRGRNPFFEMEYRALAYSGRFFPLSEAAYSSFLPPADRDWIGGYLFFRYVVDRWGTGIYARIYREYASFPLLGPWKAIERATGQRPDAIYAAMIEELRGRYRGEASVAEGSRVTPDQAGDWFQPVITKRGWYLYRQTLKDPPAIVRFDPVSRTETPLVVTPITDSASLTATADGATLAFAAYQATAGASGQVVTSDLYGVDVPSGRVHRITTGARAWQPRYNRDGTRLLAVSAMGPGSRLVDIDPRDGSMRLLFSERGAIVSAPAISPDGLRVAFTVQEGGAASVRVLPLSSPEAPLAAQDAAADFNVDKASVAYGPFPDGGWYPGFTDDDHLIISSVVRKRLALLSVPLGGGSPSVVCEDPVGAWSGALVGNEVLYSTRRANGCALMLKPLESAAPGASPSAVLAPATEEPPEVPPAAPGSSPTRADAGTPYWDFPRFMAWAPIPIYYSPLTPQSLIAAPGAVFYGESNLGTSSFFGSASFRLDVAQPATMLSLQTMLGNLGASYFLSEGYADYSPSDHRQELVQQAGLSIPIVSSTELATTTALSLDLSVTDSLSARSPGSFTFVQGVTASGPGGITTSHDLDVGAGVSFLISDRGSPMDLFPRRQLLAAVSVSAYPPLVSDSGPGETASLLASISIPSPFPHQAVKLGIKTSFVGIGGTFYELTTARGAFDPVIQDLPGRSLVALDYQIPVALLDVPLVYSLGLVGAGLGFHLEAAGSWSVAPATLRPDPDVYAGAELVLIVAAGEQSFPLGVGVALRFDPRLEVPIDWATDIRPYLFVSSDSFAGTVLQANPVEMVSTR